eukprot:9732216-Alexandrium_andersonii.AAC.1
MSASLVGSEMCIRDSSIGGRGPSSPNGPYCRRSAAPPAPASEKRGFESVSYTHLTLPTICSV